MKKKAQVNQIFVYIMSIIIVLFIGFLVTKFIFTFTADAKERVSYKVYDELETDYQDIFRTYGSEKVLDYKVPSEVKFICFIANIKSIQNLDILSDAMKSDLNQTLIAGDNVAIFDSSNLLKSSKNIGSFNIDSGSFCIEPNNGYFKILFENRRNKVYISQN